MEVAQYRITKVCFVYHQISQNYQESLYIRPTRFVENIFYLMLVLLDDTTRDILHRKHTQIVYNS